jgi:hypothetical protein
VDSKNARRVAGIEVTAVVGYGRACLRGSIGGRDSSASSRTRCSPGTDAGSACSGRGRTAPVSVAHARLTRPAVDSANGHCESAGERRGFMGGSRNWGSRCVRRPSRSTCRDETSHYHSRGRTFLANHVGQIMTADFFVVPYGHVPAVVRARDPRARPVTDCPRRRHRPSLSCANIFDGAVRAAFGSRWYSW